MITAALVARMIPGLSEESTKIYPPGAALIYLNPDAITSAKSYDTQVAGYEGVGLTILVCGVEVIIIAERADLFAVRAA